MSWVKDTLKAIKKKKSKYVSLVAELEGEEVELIYTRSKKSEFYIHYKLSSDAKGVPKEIKLQPYFFKSKPPKEIVVECLLLGDKWYVAKHLKGTITQAHSQRMVLNSAGFYTTLGIVYTGLAEDMDKQWLKDWEAKWMPKLELVRKKKRMSMYRDETSYVYKFASYLTGNVIVE